MKIRKARPKDTDRIFNIEQSCFPDSAFSHRSIAYHVKRNLVLCAEVDGIIIGYIILSPLMKSKRRRIYSIGVDPAHREKKAGYNLMLAIEYKSGAKEIILEVDETNHPAIRLYEKMGYQQFGRYENYYGRTDALRMKKMI